MQRRLLASGRSTKLVLRSGRLDFPLHDVVAAREEMQTLVVDDAHLLDADSADQLLRLASQQKTCVVATVRAGEWVPDRVTRLWTGGDAVLLLAEILVIQGRVAEGDALFGDLDFKTLSVVERHAVTYSKALGRTRLGELNSVIAMITGTEVAETANSRQLQAIYGQALMLDGRIDEASEVVSALFADLAVDPVTRTIAANTLVGGGAFAGRTNESHRIMRDALPPAEAARTALPFCLGNIMVRATICLAGAGQLDEAEAIAQQAYDRALAEDDEWLRPRGASGLGVTALIRGSGPDRYPLLPDRRRITQPPRRAVPPVQPVLP